MIAVRVELMKMKEEARKCEDKRNSIAHTRIE